MEKLTKDIIDIVIAETSNINEKIKGLNFLELLKISLIEKLLVLINKNPFPLDKIIDFEKEIEISSRKLLITVNYLIESLSLTKKQIDNDSLIIGFNEYSNFDIYIDQKKFVSIILSKNSGISLPRETLFNAKYKKNILLLKIINKDSDQTLTN